LRPPGKWNTAFSGVSVPSTSDGRRTSGSPPRRTDRPWSVPCGRAGRDQTAPAPKMSGRDESGPWCHGGCGFAELLRGRPAECRVRTVAGRASVARDFDHKIVGQRVDHGHADAVQAAGGLVDLAVELAAGVQHGHDHFKRGLAGKLRMVFHRDAAAIVGDRQIAVGIKLDFDEIGVSGDGFVHRVVDDFGETGGAARVVGAADIHARTASHRFQALRGPRWPRRHNHRRWPALGRIWRPPVVPWLSALGCSSLSRCVFSVFGSALPPGCPLWKKDRWNRPYCVSLM
jgi:hypothetical protein